MGRGMPGANATPAETFAGLYLGIGETYDVGVHGSHIGNRLWPFDWRNNICA